MIPKLIDEIAFSDPQRPFISIPKSTNLQDGYVDISYNIFVKAVNRLSWWIEEELGQTQQSKTLFYIGSLDLRYLVIILAAAKTGHMVSLSSSLVISCSLEASTNTNFPGVLQLPS